MEEGREPPTALYLSQQWLREVTNAQLSGYFKQHLPEFGQGKLPKDLADYGYKHSMLGDPDTQPYAHPFYWAGFYYTGS
jgi:CHAT domain-containing protein